MNNDFLNQAMIAMPMSDRARGSGIMAGLMGDDESYSQERSPGDPEILMNNLRGDMRSVDARYMELAQMVGEEAAQDTPPEVLALLQSQMAAPPAPAGIGALPGAPTPDQLPGGMAPPPPPPQQAPGSMAQGPMPTPPGGGGIGPFSNSGATQAPPTPDGLPPIKAAGGAFISNAARWLRELISSGESAREAARTVDQALGNQFLIPQPTPAVLENVRGPKGQYTAEQYVTGGDLRYPTLTEGVGEGARAELENLINLSRRKPAVPIGIGSAGGIGVGSALITSEKNDKERIRAFADPYSGQGSPDREQLINNIPRQIEPIDQIPIYPPYSAESYSGLGEMGAENYMGPGGASQQLEELASPAKQATAPAGSTAAERLRALVQADQAAMAASATKAEGDAAMAASATKAEGDAAKPAADKRTDSISEMLKKLTEAQASSNKPRNARLKEETAANVALYNEILGDNAKDRQVQALLLLAEAGFKFAGNARPTMAMALADSLSGVTKGMSALAAQKAEREQKIKLAALQSAESTIAAQDKAAVAERQDTMKYVRDVYLQSLKDDAAMNREQLKINADMNLEQFKAQWGNRQKLIEIKARGVEDRATEMFKNDLKNLGGPIQEEEGAGLVSLKHPTTKSFIGFAINPSDASVKSYLSSPLNLNAANPYVFDRGSTPQISITDRTERVKAVKEINATSSLIGKLDDAMTAVMSSYGPRAFLSDFSNNVLVPTVPLLQPNLETAENKTKIDSALKSVMKVVADNGDRLSNQQMQWIQEFLPKTATSFFQSPEVALKQLQTLRTNLLNSRHDMAASLGFETRDLKSEVPALGTQNDPFSLPGDEQQRTMMLGWLANSLSNASPSGIIYIRMPNGAVQPWKVQDFMGSK